MDVKKWLMHEFSSSSEGQPDYLEFQEEYYGMLVRKAATNGLKTIAFNKQHYEFATVLQSKKTGICYYFSIPDVRFSKNDWNKKIMWREMRHPNDWVGLSNHYAPLVTIFKEIKSYDEKKPKS